MKKQLISLALTGAMLLSNLPVALAGPAAGFTDMPQDWSRPALEQAVDNGLLQGSNGKIDAYGTLTRSQMAAIMVRAFGAKARADLSGYSDVPAGAWYYEAMAAAVAMGVFQGADGRLNPDAPITRQEAFTVLARAFLLAPKDPEAHAAFDDGAQVADWAKPSMAVLVEQGYVQGSGGKLMPAATMTRAEFAQLVSNLVTSFDNASGTVEGNVVLRQGVTIPAGTEIAGDLIAGEGVDINALDLTGVTITGRVVVRGGASVTLGKDTQVGGVVVANTQAPVSVTNDSGSNVDVTVAGAKEVTLNGGYGKVEVSAGNAEVTLADGKADQVLVSGADAEITVSKDAQVKEVTVSSGADNAAVEVRGKADKVTTAASGTEVSGTGKVSKVEAQAGSEGAKVTTPNTSITVDKEAGAVETAKGTVEPGKTGSSSQTKPSDNSSSSTPAPATTDIIYNGKATAPILMDASYPEGREHAYTQVARAVGDLRQDIAMVNGAIDYRIVQQLFDDDSDKQTARLNAADQQKVPQLLTDPSAVTADYAIIVGSVKDSQIIRDLVNNGKLSGASTITDESAWEAYTIQEVENPTDTIKKALVIAGADARGTIFGIYTISEEIGVSPWYWYSDVPVKTKNTISVDYSTALTVKSPDVKYRGIFINDEEYSNYWARGKFAEAQGESESTQPGVNYYRRLFEVILRMKGNTLWPAMHKRSTAFFATKNENGDSINGIEAGKYGIVMGSSHCEILLRNSNSEWNGWIQAYNSREGVSNTNSSYNFCTNKDAMLQYWRERLQEAQRNGVEGVMVLGLRGKHDGAAEYTDGYYTDRTDMMKAVIKAQRALIKEVYGSADAVAQVYVAYDDLGERYNDGVNALLASPDYDDIIVMWANDSYGYLRQTPNADEQKRPGGSGIYYHTSYMGWDGERKSYLFLNSLPIQQMNEQMRRAYDSGMQTYWILNVGDLKPGDLLANYFLDMGWDIDGHPDTGVHDYLADWCVRQYTMSPEDAEHVATAMEEFYNLTNMKKAEFYGAQNSDPPFSGSMAYPLSVISLGDEGQRAVDRANAMVDAMTVAYEKMDAETQNAFFEQMYFLAQAYRDITEEYVYYWKNLEYARQGRAGSAVLYEELSQKALAHLLEKVDEYGTLNNGKWERFISPVHRYTGDWGEGQNQGIVMLDESRYAAVSTGAGIGAFAEGNKTAGSGTLRFNSLSDDTRYIDIFSKSGGDESWTIEKPDWVKITNDKGEDVTGGTTSSEQRVLVSVSDWGQAVEDGAITVKGSDDNAAATFTIKAVNKADFDYDGHQGYVEANGYVMIEAEHYSANTPGSDGSSWYLVHDRGPRGDCMKVTDGLPELGSETGTGAKLTYNVYFEKAGTYPLTYYRMATLNEGSYKNVADEDVANACKTMLSVNGTNVGLMSGTRVARTGNWFKSIHTSYEPMQKSITVKQGWNTIEIIRSSPSEVFDNILIVTDSEAVLASLNGPEVSPNNIMTAEEYEAYRHGVAPLPKALENITRLDPVALNSYGQTDITIAGATSVSSSNTFAAAVELNGDIVTVQAGKAGVSTVKVRTDAGMTIFEVRVTFTPAENKGSYIPENGRFVIDVIDALEGSAYAFSKKSSDETRDWQPYGSGLQVTPDEGANWTDTNTAYANAPSVSFKIDVQEASWYTLFINTSNPDTSGDSWHAFVDGSYVGTMKADSAGKETWYCYKNASGSDDWFKELTAGEHTLTIVAREDGLCLNQIVLNKAWVVPNGFQQPTARQDRVPTLDLKNLKDLELSTADNATVTVEAQIKYGEGNITLSVASDDERVATVSDVSNSKFTVTSVAEGSTVITVTANAEDCTPVSKTFRVTVYDASDMEKAYQPNSEGVIIINAVDALLNKPYASHSNVDGTGTYFDEFKWVAVEEEKSLQLTPIADGNNKREWTDSEVTSSPSITFKVYAPAEGSYYLSVFSNSPTEFNDSFHFVVNGIHQYVSKEQVNGTQAWGNTIGEGWYYYTKKAVTLNEGYNTITINGRESGLLLRQLVLSTKAYSMVDGLDGWQTAAVAAVPVEPEMAVMENVEIEATEPQPPEQEDVPALVPDDEPADQPPLQPDVTPSEEEPPVPETSQPEAEAAPDEAPTEESQT